MSATGHKLPTAGEASLLQAKFGPVLDSVPDAIVMVNAQGCIVLANQRAEELFGYLPGELLGQSAEALLPERLRQAHAGHQEKLFCATTSAAHGNRIGIVRIAKDGSEFPAEISLNPVQTEDGAWTMSAIRDIMDQKRIQEELKAKNAAVETANQELQAFSYSISHDLRAPLRAMDGFAGMLRKSLGPNLSKETEHSLKRIKKTSPG